MEKFRIVTEEGKEIMRAETYTGCERYWDACNGIYADEDGEHYIYIEEIDGSATMETSKNNELEKNTKSPKERFEELKKILEPECPKYEDNCSTCPYAKQCEEYLRLSSEFCLD